MSRRFETLRDKALTLSIEERSWLAESLFDSLRTDEERAIEAEWLKEVERRIDDFEAGRVKAIPADEVFCELKTKLRTSRKH